MIVAAFVYHHAAHGVSAQEECEATGGVERLLGELSLEEEGDLFYGEKGKS